MALSRREELLSYISDEFKSVNGFRPRGFGFNEMSLPELEAYADKLEEEVIASIAEDRAVENRFRAAWEDGIAAAIEAGAGNRENAIKWLFAAEGLEEEDLWRSESVNWELGVGFNYNLLTGAEEYPANGIYAEAA